MEEFNSVEQKNEKKRRVFSIIITFFIQILFLMLIVVFSNFKIKEKDELPVVQVRLRDKVLEEFERLGEKEKEKVIKEQKKAEEKIKKETEKESQKNTKSKESEKVVNNTKEKSSEKEKDANKEKIIEKESENIKEVIENREKDDSFTEYNKKLEEQNREKEKDFFKDSNKKGDKNEKNDDTDIDDIDKFLKDMDNKKGGDDKSQKGSDKGKDDKNIVWEGGGARAILNYPNIKPSDDIAKSGQKPTIVIKFTVNEDGNVVSATALESTGDPNWDIDIINQFKRAKFEKRGGVTSTGKIEITIKY
ncbi:MAG TPA: energy transducer TonB [Spirochaetota bacterium]|nr:energy transducer TonB [Spirochaetota bacterium]